MRYLSITVYGKVQGVFFRKYTRQIAQSLNLNGFARNNSDGSVYIEVAGEEEEIEKFLAWCKQGPSASQVEKIETANIKPAQYKGFEIRRSQ
jgi:acylphosphatase